MRDPKTPDYVKQRIREWVHSKEQERAARQDPEPTVAQRGINFAGLLVHSVAYGVTSPDVIADVSVLEQAYVLVVGDAGHVREADAIAVRLGELGRVVERPVLAEEVPPQSELERETERIMDSENGGLVQGADGGWVTASDAALAESIGQAELERELGRVREELGLDRPAFPGGDVP